MRAVGLWRRTLFVLSVALAQTHPHAAPAAQQRKPAPKARAEAADLSVDQRHALWLLERLANDLRHEPDRPAAAALQARAADMLWKYNEGVARAIFRTAFDAARQPAPDRLTAAERSRYLNRQAASLRDVLRLFGTRDRAEADAWVKALEEKSAAEGGPRNATTTLERAQLLAQLATQLVADNPEQAQQLGRFALSGAEIPEEFGRLLFALRNQNREASDALFRQALAALRRGGYAYSNALIILSNYLFDARGVAYSDAPAADVQSLVSLFIGAAAAHAGLWRDARQSGAALVPEATAKLYGFLTSRAAPIVARYAPERLPEFAAHTNQLLTGLSQQHLREAQMLTSAQQQQVAVSARNDYDINEQIERAEKEKDEQVRDVLLRSAAVGLMRGDAERALSVAARIGDAALRAQTEDDINLVRTQRLLRMRAYDECRGAALRLNNVLLGSRLLAELASSVLAEAGDAERAAALLSEASAIAQKSEDTPGKLMALLSIAQHFAKLDPSLGFQTLSAAVKTANHLKTDTATAPATTQTGAPPLTLKSYSVINGVEVTAGEQVTTDSIDFSQVGALAAKDYTWAMAIGDTLEDKLMSAKFTLAAARGVLSTPRPETEPAPVRPVVGQTSGAPSSAPR